MVVAEVLGTQVRRRWAREFSGMRNNQSREAEAGKSTCLGREPEEVQRLVGITFRNPCGLHDAHFRDCLPTGGVTRGRHVTVPHPSARAEGGRRRRAGRAFKLQDTEQLLVLHSSSVNSQ